MPLAIWRSLRVSLVIGAVVLGAASGLGRQSTTRADDPPASEPGPEVERAIARLHEELLKVDNAMGGLSDDEQAKIAALEKSLDDQLKADFSKWRDRAFHDSVITQYRETLSGDHQKKFDAMMAENQKTNITVLNLRKIAQMCVLYRNDNNNQDPPDLGSLAVEDATPQMFLAGGSKTPLPANWNTMEVKAKSDWINQNTDFVYLAVKPGNVAAGHVLTYVKPESAPAHNSFLFDDGHVETKTAEEAKPIIDDLKAGKNPPAGMGTN